MLKKQKKDYMKKDVKILLSLEELHENTIAYIVQQGACNSYKYLLLYKNHETIDIPIEEAIAYATGALQKPDAKLIAEFLETYFVLNFSRSKESSKLQLQISSIPYDAIYMNEMRGIKEFSDPQTNLIEYIDTELYMKFALMLCRNFIIEKMDVITLNPF